MTWNQKRRALDWHWFQEDCAPNDVAQRCAALARERKLLKFILGPFNDGTLVIVSCKGTLKKAAPKKQASETIAELKARIEELLEDDPDAEVEEAK